MISIRLEYVGVRSSKAAYQGLLKIHDHLGNLSNNLQYSQWRTGFYSAIKRQQGMNPKGENGTFQDHIQACIYAFALR